jgi:hypothetical protein
MTAVRHGARVADVVGRPDRESNLGHPYFMKGVLPLHYPAGLWRNHQLQQRVTCPLETINNYHGRNCFVPVDIVEQPRA